MNRHLHGSEKTGSRGHGAKRIGSWVMGHGSRKIFLICILLFLLAPCPLSLATVVSAQSIREFPIPTNYSRPVDLAVDSSGNVWLAEENANKLARFDVRKETFEEIDIPYKNAAPSSIVIKPVPAGFKQGNDILWAALSLDNSITSFTIPSKIFKRFEIPTNDSGPYGIAADKDGIVWFTERNANKIGRLVPSTGKFKEYPVPTQNSQPAGITIGKDGFIWFTEAGGNKLGMLDHLTGSITEYDILTKFANPSRITTDNDGNIWFLEQSSNKLGMFDVSKKKFNNAVIPTPASVPTGIAVDKNNIVWFTENRGNKLGMFNPVRAFFLEHEIPTQRSLPTGIAIDGNGTIWFTEVDRDANKLGMLAQQSTVSSEQLDDRGKGQGAGGKKEEPFYLIGGIILISAAIVVLYLARRGKRK